MVSLVVIAKNEADRIGECLQSVPIATEKIVLDCGSLDETVSIARSSGARVVQTDWPGFVIQKNRALEEASGSWVLSLDADERLSKEAVMNLMRAIENPGAASGMSFPRCSNWLGREIRHGRWYPDRQVRVVKRGRGRWVGGAVHESLQVDGPVLALSGDIEHVPYRSFREHLSTIRRYSALDASSMADDGVRARWWHLAGGPPLHFVNAYLFKMGFRDGGAGLALAGLGAAHVAMKWMRLWLHQHR
ncbi:MAG: glycosyltransferase family 2 protein [Proteobacteria bacterium]|nr:glycosyltransferase family 2 protein [Pseudomonadota bacterium]